MPECKGLSGAIGSTAGLPVNLPLSQHALPGLLTNHNGCTGPLTMTVPALPTRMKHINLRGNLFWFTGNVPPKTQICLRTIMILFIWCFGNTWINYNIYNMGHFLKPRSLNQGNHNKLRYPCWSINLHECEYSRILSENDFHETLVWTTIMSSLRGQ